MNGDKDKMARKLTLKEFCQKISDTYNQKIEKRANINADLVQDIYETMVDVLINELITYNQATLPLITEIMELKEYKNLVRLPDGTMVRPKKNTKRLRVTYTETFKEQINGLDTTRYEKKKNRELVRMEKLKEQEFERQKQIKEKHDKQFAEMLETKKQKAIERKQNKRKSQKQLALEERQNNQLDYGEE